MTKRVILPAEADEKMMLAGMAMAEMMASATQGDAIIAGFDAMLAASTNAGKVTEAELEAMAEGIYEFCRSDSEVSGPPFSELHADEKAFAVGIARAALVPLGLEVEG